MPDDRLENISTPFLCSTRMEPRIPDFFIVGAPKCGTTALYSYLRQHPDVFMPSIKEVQFFCSDLRVPPAVPDERAYRALFSDARTEKRVGEASVWYLYSHQAASAIRRFNPDSSVIIMLRNPVDMLYALHSQRIQNGVESTTDFELALNGFENLSKLTSLLAAPDPRSGPFGVEVGKYSQHVRRYLQEFGEEKVCIIVYDDFMIQPSSVFRRVLTFLDVNENFAPIFETVNANKKVRSVLLQRMVRTPSAPLRLVVRSLLPRSIRQYAAERIAEANKRRAPRAPLPANLRRRLIRELAPDIEELGQLLGRDLADWLSA